MSHRITILTLSRKWGGRCVAGYDHTDSRVVRLVSDIHGKELNAQLTAGVNLLDVVDVDILCSCPNEHQIENILISPDSNLTVTGSTNVIESFAPLAYNSGNIFGNTHCKISDALDMDHSIELIKFSRMSIYVENGTTKADFFAGGKLHRWYRVTDIVHEGKAAMILKGYAIITIPPSDDFTSENGYYKYAAAIYPTNI